MQHAHRFTIRLQCSRPGCFLHLFLQRRFVKMILSIIKNIIYWCFLKRQNRTQQFELLEFGMPFQQTSKFEAAAKSCVSKDSGCTSCSRLRAAGKHWYCPQHQVSQLTSSGNGLKTVNIFDVKTCQNLSKAALVVTRCTCAQFAQSCHLRCPRWGWQPPIWWTSFHLWPAAPRHGNCEWKCVNICSSVDSMWQWFSMA